MVPMTAEAATLIWVPTGCQGCMQLNRPRISAVSLDWPLARRKRLCDHPLPPAQDGLEPEEAHGQEGDQIEAELQGAEGAVRSGLDLGDQLAASLPTLERHPHSP